MKRTKKWLKEALGNAGIEPAELAEASGIDLKIINEILQGDFGGSLKVWKAIENAFFSFSHTVSLVSSNGDVLQIEIKGHQRAFFQMFSIATEYGFDHNIVADYIFSMDGLFKELLESQQEMISSDEAFVYDPHTTRVLNQLGNDFLEDPETILKYFKTWLGVKTN